MISGVRIICSSSQCDELGICMRLWQITCKHTTHAGGATRTAKSLCYLITTNNSRYASPHSRYPYARNQKVGTVGIGPQHRMDVQNLHPGCPFSGSVLALPGNTACRGSREFKVPSSVALSARLIDLHPCDVLHPLRHTPLCAPDRAVCRPACQESHLSSD